MRYEFCQASSDTITLAILENVEVKNGAVYGTKVGKLSGFDDDTHEAIYVSCTPVKFIAGGGPWDMIEYTKEL